MKRNHLTRFAIPAVLVAIATVFLTGCPGVVTAQFEQWDHVISLAEFTDHTTYMEYVYNDPRFNNDDFFDMHKVEAGGVSDFDSVYDAISPSLFLYQPVYTNGSVSWFAHPGANFAMEGETLRFYRISN